MNRPASPRPERVLELRVTFCFKLIDVSGFSPSLQDTRLSNDTVTRITLQSSMTHLGQESYARRALESLRNREITVMNSPVKKRSIVIGCHRTSVSLEDDFWTSLRQIARGRQVTISHLIASLDAARENSNLSSTIRVFILDHYCAMAGQSPGSIERQIASVS